MSPRYFQLLAFCLLPFFAWAQAGDISSPGRADPSLVQISPPPAESAPNSRAAPSAITEEGKVQFRAQTILVQVPVVVTDKSGDHVHGLTRSDFHIFENGKEQKIATFEEIVATSKPLPVAPLPPGEFSNLALSDRQPRPVAVIALDTINTPLLDQANARRALIKYLAENLDSVQVLALMIITSHGVKVVHGLTDDPAQLVQLVKTASPDQPALLGLGPDTQANAVVGDIPNHPTAADLNRPFAAAAAALARGDTINAQSQQQRAIEQTLNAFLEIAWSLSGVPGRKSLIWATGGFPFAISSADQVPGGYLAPLYERAMQALDAAQISVYPVDVRGLVATDASAAVIAATAPEFARQVSNRTDFQRTEIQTFIEFADMTGGKAFYNTNDLASSFKSAAEDASSYYLAGYYLDTLDKKAGWRDLKIKVDKKDAEVRAREGFFVTNITMNPDLTRSYDLDFALSSPIDGTGVPLSVKWLGASGAGVKKNTEFLVHLPPGSVSVEGTKRQKRVNFDFVAAAYPNDPEAAAHTSNTKTETSPITISRTVTTSVSDTQLVSLLANGIDMKNTLQLASGEYLVRVVIRDNLTGKIGSVTATLTVN